VRKETEGTIRAADVISTDLERLFQILSRGITPERFPHARHTGKRFSSSSDDYFPRTFLMGDREIESQKSTTNQRSNRNLEKHGASHFAIRDSASR